MSYSCTDFTDSILDALEIDLEPEDYDNPAAQADLALAEIDRLQKCERVVKEIAEMRKCKHRPQLCQFIDKARAALT